MKQANRQDLSDLELSQARERVMMERLLDMARDFYSKPENRLALEKWKAERSQRPPERPISHTGD